VRDRSEKLEDLIRVAQHLSDRSLAPVAAAQDAVRAAQAQVTQIETHYQKLAHAGETDPVQAAILARHANSLRALKAGALSDLARQKAALEQAKANARPAFGRVEVLKRIAAAKAGNCLRR